jgi:hypothetical protein
MAHPITRLLAQASGAVETARGSQNSRDITTLQRNPGSTVLVPSLLAVANNAPFDGQEIAMRVGSTLKVLRGYSDPNNDGVVWRFRYSADAAQAGNLAWEFIGGPALYAFNDGVVSSASTFYANPGGLPLLTVPYLANFGDFDIAIGARIANQTLTTANNFFSYTINATSASDNDAITVYSGAYGNFQRLHRHTNIPFAGNYLSFQTAMRCDSGTLSISSMWISIIPIRIG